MLTTNIPKTNPKRLAVKLSVTGERSVRIGHPWIFSESIEKINDDSVSGDIAIIFSHTKNKVIGVGLYDPDSPIRIKMLHSGGGATIDREFFSEKIILPTRVALNYSKQIPIAIVYFLEKMMGFPAL